VHWGAEPLKQMKMRPLQDLSKGKGKVLVERTPEVEVSQCGVAGPSNVRGKGKVLVEATPECSQELDGDSGDSVMAEAGGTQVEERDRKGESTGESSIKDVEESDMEMSPIEE
jgi:hypothetical protein